MKKKDPVVQNLIFDQSEKFHNYIHDLGINIKHPNKDHIMLDDVFVYPDLEHINSNDVITYKQINSENILEKYNYCHLIGSDKSGKTALLKKYCKDFINKNYQVVTLKATDVKHYSAEQLVKICARKFDIQFDLDKDNFVLLIDDFHQLEISEKYESDFYKSITDFFKGIYFFEDKQFFFGDRSKHLNITFEIFEIKNLGHLKRNELYSKWYGIGTELPYTQNDEEFLRKIDTVTNHFDLLLRKNVMDAKPMYILTIIQTLDNLNVSRDFSLTSYGHCYNTLILSLLHKANVSHHDFDSILNFLSFLSYKMFVDREKSISEENLNVLIKEYHKDYVINLDVKKVLVDSNILYMDENLDYIFSQKYIYYFSCSKYIAMNQTKLSDLVKELCDTIHTEESANILIFLVHHSNSTDFIDDLLKYSTNLLTNSIPHFLTLEQNQELNLKFKSILNHEMKQIRLENKNIYDERNKQLTLKDNIPEPDDVLESAINSLDVSDNKVDIKENIDQNAEISEINEAHTIFRCLEVLGQIAKNKYGSFNRSRLETLLNSSYILGLKSLSFFLDVLMKSDNDLKDFMISIIEEKEMSSNEAALNLAEKMIFEMCKSVCRYLINFISKATASPQLEEITKELLSKESNPAYQLIYIQTQLSLGKLPRNEIKKLYEDENEKNLIVANLLQHMVLNFVYMNKVNFNDKKWISSTLRIQMNNQYSTTPSHSLVQSIL